MKGSIATTTGSQTGKVLFAVGLPPQASWNGRFVFVGGGGFQGSLPSPTALLPFGFVEAVTDTGHESIFGPAASLDGRFALLEPGNIPNMAAIEDFAYRAVHLSTVAGQSLTNQYYGAPMRSYFDGCSTGGRQALVEAQKFPGDFNGLVAGDPAIGDPIAGFNWNDLALLNDSTGDSWLPPAQTAVLDAAVTAACDGSDGVIDGLIEDPRLCKFDPASIQCSKTLTSNCLTAAQVATLRKIYAGRYDSRRNPALPRLFSQQSRWQRRMGAVDYRICASARRFRGRQSVRRSPRIVRCRAAPVLVPGPVHEVLRL